MLSFTQQELKDLIILNLDGLTKTERITAFTDDFISEINLVINISRSKLLGLLKNENKNLSIRKSSI